MLLKDTKDISFIAYRNGVIEVMKHEVKLIDYIDVDGYIWENQIIQRDFVFSENEMKNAVASAYKIRTPHCKYFEDYSKVERIKKDLVKGKDKVIEIHKIDNHYLMK